MRYVLLVVECTAYTHYKHISCIIRTTQTYYIFGFCAFESQLPIGFRDRNADANRFAIAAFELQYSPNR